MLEDLRSQYKTAEQALSSRRGARRATVSLQLTGVEQAVWGLEQDYATCNWGLTNPVWSLSPAIADLARRSRKPNRRNSNPEPPLRRAEAALTSAQSVLGPVSGKIERAEKKSGLKPIPLPEFAGAPADLCASEAVLRERQAETLEADIRTMERECGALSTRHNEIKDKLSHVQSLAKRAEGHVREASRDEPGFEPRA